MKAPKPPHTLAIVVAMLALSACNRIPLTPPIVSSYDEATMGTWDNDSIDFDAAEGIWTFGVEVGETHQEHWTTWTSNSDGSAWSLIYHIPQSESAVSPFGIGYWPHHPSSFAEDWDGLLHLSGASNGTLILQEQAIDSSELLSGVLDWQWPEGENWTFSWSETFNDSSHWFIQEVDVQLAEREPCQLDWLREVFTAETDEYGENWELHPPTSPESLVWHWNINGIEQESFGNETVQVTTDTESLFVILSSGAGGDHPWGEFSCQRSWEWDDFETEFDAYIQHDFYWNRTTESTPWIELQHLTSDGLLYSSQMDCSNWEEELIYFEVDGMEANQSSVGEPSDQWIDFRSHLEMTSVTDESDTHELYLNTRWLTRIPD